MESVPDNFPEAKKRRSTRIVQAVPLIVTGVDALGRPFQERTSTLIVNCHGCRYQSKHYVLKNMWLTLEVPHPDTGQPPRKVRAKVMWIQRPRTVRELFQVGAELEVPGNFWGIGFPPEDWFPFPEGAALPGPETGEQPKAASSEEWSPPATAEAESSVHVVPAPGEAEASLTLARQMARLLVEAKQQIQSAVREAAAKSVAAETQSLLGNVQTQLNEAAQRAVEAAAISQTDQLLRQTVSKIEEARETQIEALRDRWSRELRHHAEEAWPQTAAQLAETSRAHLANFERQLADHIQQALANLKNVSSEFRAAESAERRSEQVPPEIDRAIESVQARLAKLEEAASDLQKEIAPTATPALAEWGRKLEADMDEAGARWNESLGASLDGAVRAAAQRLAEQAQAASRELERELTQRAATFRQAFEPVATEAQTTLTTLRAALDQEEARAQSVLAERQRITSQLEEYALRFHALRQATTEQLERNLEAILAAHSTELERRTDAALGAMAERLQPVLEAAGQQSVARLAAHLERQLATYMEQGNVLLSKLSDRQGAMEETLRTHEKDLRRASEEALEQTALKLQEASDSATSKWLAEPDEKATDTTHKTFEALFKASQWYEKKIYTQTQAAMEKGVEQATASLREKAGELSRAFASELNHYSRSYVEHTQRQLDESVRENVEKGREQLAQAGETTAARFDDDAHGLAQAKLEQFAGSLETALAQARAKREAEGRQFVVDFHKGMSQEIQRGVAQARRELEAQIEPAKEAWRNEREAQQRQLQGKLADLVDESVEAYKQRLENVSNSWLVTTVTKFGQQSQEMIAHLSQAAEQQLQDTCSQVFARVGEALRQRLTDRSGKPAQETPPKQES